ncbi:DmpA/ArgJ-like protein [Acephala macrosclerotiorum]|nr:DmpA/ArgJ-like protein [Acephala macrosclerotiorum]
MWQCLQSDQALTNNIIKGIPKLYKGMGNSHDHWLEVARGLCTTDTFPKLGRATTLGIICTDAPIQPNALRQLLSTATDKSYNCISVDGDTSTNDMVAILSNGAAGGNPISIHASAREKSEDFLSFQQTLTEFMSDMAKLVVRDGEGATKFITIRVRSAPNHEIGKHVASAITRSVLFKTAVYGKEANWGGVLVALGQSLMGTKWEGKGIIVPETTSISFFLDQGKQGEVDTARATEVMEHEDIEVQIDLRDGENVEGQELEEAVCWTCDLTHEFVTINGGFDTAREGRVAEFRSLW